MSVSISPFDLKRHLKRPDLTIEAIPLVDFCVLALLFSFLGSQFIFSPGLSIDLPRSGAPSLNGVATSAVLSVNAPNMLFFEGEFHSLSTLQPALKAFVSSQRAPKPILLLKMNRQVAMQTLVTIAEFARTAGFRAVQIAAQPVPGPGQDVPYLQKPVPGSRDR